MIQGGRGGLVGRGGTEERARRSTKGLRAASIDVLQRYNGMALFRVILLNLCTSTNRSKRCVILLPRRRV